MTPFVLRRLKEMAPLLTTYHHPLVVPAHQIAIAEIDTKMLLVRCSDGGDLQRHD